jgi:hypothetical protein
MENPVSEESFVHGFARDFTESTAQRDHLLVIVIQDQLG